MSAGWFVDGEYAFKAWQALQRGDRIDFVKLRQLLETNYLGDTEVIEEAYYFDAAQDPGTARQTPFHRLLTYSPPSGPGFRVKLYGLREKELRWPPHMGGKRVVHPITGELYIATNQKAVDVALAFHMLRSVHHRKWNKLFLFAGDGDFSELIQHLVENENISVALIGTRNSISQELRCYAKSVVELDKFADDFSMPLSSDPESKKEATNSDESDATMVAKHVKTNENEET